MYLFTRKGRLDTAPGTIPPHEISAIAAFDNKCGMLNWKHLSTYYNFQILFVEPYIGREFLQAFLINWYKNYGCLFWFFIKGRDAWEYLKEYGLFWFFPFFFF